MDSLQSVFDWGSTQIEFALFLVMFVMLLFFAFKRAWIALISTIVGLAFLAIFVADPIILIKLSEWLASKVSTFSY